MTRALLTGVSGTDVNRLAARLWRLAGGKRASLTGSWMGSGPLNRESLTDAHTHRVG